MVKIHLIHFERVCFLRCIVNCYVMVSTKTKLTVRTQCRSSSCGNWYSGSYSWQLFVAFNGEEWTQVDLVNIAASGL